jgi:hypothetical protein
MKRLHKLIFINLFAIFLLAACTNGAPSKISDVNVVEVVEGFGSKLQAVDLLSPNMAEEISREYSEFISPDLLAKWISNPTLAPGRLVSSPWQERIDISSVSRVTDNEYLVSGEIIEVTSFELVSGAAANRIPVRITLGWLEGRWLITGFTGKSVAP